MRIVDMNSDAAKLNKALDTLKEAWGETIEKWEDENARNFQENHLEPIGPAIKMALDSTNRLAEVLARAQRECED